MRGERPTRDRILALLRGGPRQAQELAPALGIDTSAVRRHLERLRAEGLVERSDVAEGVGRPKTRYALTPGGREAFPRDYALLLAGVLRKVEERHGRGEVRRLMADLAHDLAAPAKAAGDREARLAALARTYDDLGFEATIEGRGRERALVQRNCIFLQAAERDPDAVCGCLDQGILRAGLPEAEIDLVECMATGDARCRHRIRFLR